MKYLVILACLIVTPAVAQQSQQLAPTNIAIQISSAVNQMALELEQDRQALQNMQKQLAEAQARLAAAEKKPETKSPVK